MSTRSLKYTTTEPDNKILDQPLPSTGCGLPLVLKTGTATNIAMPSGKIQRLYRLYLPVHYTNTLQHPLLLNFHGYAANAYTQERISQFDPLANNNQFIVVYPNGTFDKFGLRGWNTGLHPSITANDVLFVSNLLNHLQSNFCINPAQIYATGFSNGGGFVNLLACKLSNRIAAFAPVSGSYVTPFKICTIKRPVPIIEFHGTADKTVPYNGDLFTKEFSVLNWIDDWIKQDECLKKPTILYQSTKIVAYTWPDCKSQAAIVHYKIINEPHVWPRILFPQTVNGQTQYVNAATIIWNFFSQHPLPSSLVKST